MKVNIVSKYKSILATIPLKMYSQPIVLKLCRYLFVSNSIIIKNCVPCKAQHASYYLLLLLL